MFVSVQKPFTLPLNLGFGIPGFDMLENVVTGV
jgi:hypothetical protein